MSDPIKNILHFWDRNRVYGMVLTEGLSDDQCVIQPVGEVNHAAWVLAHLNTYHGVICSIIRNEPFEDPIDAPYGMHSKPLADPSAYPPLKQMREDYERGHHAVAEALREIGMAVFDLALPLERWVGWLPDMMATLSHLMIWHETVHLGQLSAWRRAMGFAAVNFLPIPAPK